MTEPGLKWGTRGDVNTLIGKKKEKNVEKRQKKKKNRIYKSHESDRKLCLRPV